MFFMSKHTISTFSQEEQREPIPEPVFSLCPAPNAPGPTAHQHSTPYNPGNRNFTLYYIMNTNNKNESNYIFIIFVN